MSTPSRTPRSSPAPTSSSSSHRLLPQSAPSRRLTRTTSTRGPTGPTIDIFTLLVEDIRAIACAMGVVQDVPISGTSNGKWVKKAILLDHIVVQFDNSSIISAEHAHELIKVGQDIITHAKEAAANSGEEKKREENAVKEREEEEKEKEHPAARFIRIAHERRNSSAPRSPLPPSSLATSLNLLGPTAKPIPHASSSYSLTPTPTSTNVGGDTLFGPDQQQSFTGLTSGTSLSHQGNTAQGEKDMHSMMRDMIARAFEEGRAQAHQPAHQHIHDQHASHVHMPSPAPVRDAVIVFSPEQIAYMKSRGVSLPTTSVSASSSPDATSHAHGPPSSVPSSSSSFSTIPPWSEQNMRPHVLFPSPDDVIPELDVHAIMGTQLKPYDPAVLASLKNGTCWDLDKYLRPRMLKEEHDVLLPILMKDGHTQGHRKVSDKRVVKNIDDLIEAIAEGCSLLTEHALVRDRVQFLMLVTQLSKEHEVFAVIRYARTVMERRLSPLVDVAAPTIAQRCISKLHEAAYHGLTAPRPPSATAVGDKRKAAAIRSSDDASSRAPKRVGRSATRTKPTKPALGYITRACRSHNRGTTCARSPCEYNHVCMWCGDTAHTAPTAAACQQHGGTPTPPGGSTGRGV